MKDPTERLKLYIDPLKLPKPAKELLLMQLRSEFERYGSRCFAEGAEKVRENNTRDVFGRDIDIFEEERLAQEARLQRALGERTYTKREVETLLREAKDKRYNGKQ